MQVIDIQKKRREITEQKLEELDWIAERLFELNSILGFSADKNGNSLAERAETDEDACRLHQKIMQRHAKEEKERESLMLRWNELAKELGIYKN